MKKKGQVHISETIAVLFIFFVLLIFGIITYAKFQQGALREKQEELLANKAIEIATKALFLPEFSCTRGESDDEDNCIDLLKARWISENKSFEENIDYYFELFSFSNISIEQVSPQAEPGEEVIVLYSKKDQNQLNREETYFVISLKDADNRYGYGLLKVEVYS